MKEIGKSIPALLACMNSLEKYAGFSDAELKKTLCNIFVSQADVAFRAHPDRCNPKVIGDTIRQAIKNNKRTTRSIDAHLFCLVMTEIFDVDQTENLLREPESRGYFNLQKSLEETPWDNNCYLVHYNSSLSNGLVSGLLITSKIKGRATSFIAPFAAGADMSDRSIGFLRGELYLTDGEYVFLGRHEKIEDIEHRVRFYFVPTTPGGPIAKKITFGTIHSAAKGDPSRLLNLCCVFEKLDHESVSKMHVRNESDELNKSRYLNISQNHKQIFDRCESIIQNPSSTLNSTQLELIRATTRISTFENSTFLHNDKVSREILKKSLSNLPEAYGELNLDLLPKSGNVHSMSTGRRVEEFRLQLQSIS